MHINKEDAVEMSFDLLGHPNRARIQMDFQVFSKYRSTITIYS